MLRRAFAQRHQSGRQSHEVFNIFSLKKKDYFVFLQALKGN